MEYSIENTVPGSYIVLLKDTIAHHEHPAKMSAEFASELHQPLWTTLNVPRSQGKPMQVV
jgi:hypothetical protein